VADAKLKSAGAEPGRFPAAPARDLACANCGATLTGAFCATCGQSAESLSRPFLELIEQFLESMFHFDSRGLRSMMRLFDPGALTVAYRAGRRAAFVPPVRIYIFVSLIFFLVLGASGIAIVQIVSIAGKTSAFERGPGARPDAGSPKAPEASEAPTPARAGAVDLDLRFLEKLQPPLAGALPPPPVAIDAGDGPIGRAIERAAAGFGHAMTDPTQLNRVVNDLFAKMMFVLLPIFALILGLLHIRQRIYLIDHLVFALHAHAFLFLALTLVIAAVAWLGMAMPPVGWFIGLIALYLLIAMRRVYRQSWLRTAAKTILLIGLYSTIFLIAIVALVLVSLREI
jgi:hypothetical protein